MAVKNKTGWWARIKQAAMPLFTLLTLLTGIVGVGVAPAAHADTLESWGPQDRPTYTWKSPADHVTFNSITDNPELGDERNFVRIREADSGQNFVDDVDITPGKEYEVLVWYHNNAKTSLNKSGAGVAKNVRLLLNIPEVVPAGKSAAIEATISADNATPNSVYDMAFATTDRSVALRYVPNSAVMHLNEPGTYDEAKGGWYDAKGYPTAEGQILNADAMFGKDEYGGVMLTYWNDAWGTLPGCSEYSGYVTFRLAVDKPNFEMAKTVRKEGTVDYAERITAKPGDILEFKLEYKNTGTTIQKTVGAKDTLPEGLTYIPGSVYFKSSRHEEGKKVPDDLFGVGLNLGDYEPQDSFFVTYQVQVDDDFDCGETVIYNEGMVGTQNGTGTDRTAITVKRECTCVTNPEMEGCQVIPSTGPMEALIALTIVAVIGGGCYYYYLAQKKLQKLTEAAGKTAAHKDDAENNKKK